MDVNWLPRKHIEMRYGSTTVLRSDSALIQGQSAQPHNSSHAGTIPYAARQLHLIVQWSGLTNSQWLGTDVCASLLKCTATTCEDGGVEGKEPPIFFYLPQAAWNGGVLRCLLSWLATELSSSENIHLHLHLHPSQP